MNAAERVLKLLAKGEWNFKVEGVWFARKNLSFRARINIIQQLLSGMMRLTRVCSYPYSLTVEPASVCNLNCPTCPAGLKTVMCSPALLRLEDFKKTINLIGDYLTFIQLWSWGEPFLNPDLCEMIEYAKKKGIIVVTSTNVHFFQNEDMLRRLMHSGLDELILAVDGTTQEVYEKCRQGGNLQTVLEGIKLAVKIKKDEGTIGPRLHMRMVVNHHNEHQKNVFAELARTLGADVVSFKKVDIGMGGVEGDDSLVPENADYALKISNGKKRYKCNSFWNYPVLASSGKIGLCSLDSGRDTNLVSVSQVKSFSDVWNCAEARECRRNFSDNPDFYPFCRKCASREPDFVNAHFDMTVF